jgi:hypothetical protein
VGPTEVQDPRRHFQCSTSLGIHTTVLPFQSAGGD